MHCMPDDNETDVLSISYFTNTANDLKKTCITSHRHRHSLHTCTHGHSISDHHVFCLGPLLLMFLAGGQKDNSKDLEKEEMYRQQQELLEARRSGSTLKDANARRQKVAVSSAATPAATTSATAPEGGGTRG